jgi:phage FluMu protein gp41
VSEGIRRRRLGEAFDEYAERIGMTPRERSMGAVALVADDAVARHERRFHALDKTAGPLYDGDQILNATADELATIALVASKVECARIVQVVKRLNSPWVEFSIATRATEDEDEPTAYAVERYALWRKTLAVHRIGDDGAVEDDPITP